MEYVGEKYEDGRRKHECKQIKIIMYGSGYVAERTNEGSERMYKSARKVTRGMGG